MIIDTASSVPTPRLREVEQLVLADLRRRSPRARPWRRAILYLDVREGVGAASIADQHRVALRVIARAFGLGCDPHQSAVAVVGLAGRNALAYDGAPRVLADVDHLGAGVGLLVIVGQRDRVELADRVVAEQHTGRILPGDRRTGLDLRPGDLRVAPGSQPALGDEVVDAADAVLVARVPVLDRRVLDRRAVERHEFDDRRVQLVRVELRRRTAFEVADRRAFLGDDQRALELPEFLALMRK